MYVRFSFVCLPWGQDDGDNSEEQQQDKRQCVGSFASPEVAGILSSTTSRLNTVSTYLPTPPPQTRLTLHHHQCLFIIVIITTIMISCCRPFVVHPGRSVSPTYLQKRKILKHKVKIFPSLPRRQQLMIRRYWRHRLCYSTSHLCK